MRQVLISMSYALVSGIAYALSLSNDLEGFPLGLLAWVALVPLHRLLEGATPRQAFWWGWCTGLIAFIGTVYWVITAMHLYGQVPLPISVGLMILLATYLGLYVGLYAWGVARMQWYWPAMLFLGAPCLWVFLEWVRTHLLTGLPWGLLGYSQFRFLPVIQFVDHTGVYGVSFLIILVNITIHSMVHWAIPRKNLRHLPSFTWSAPLTALVLLTTVLTYGMWQLGQDERPTSPNTALRIGLVQANIKQSRKWDAAYRLDTMDRYARLTKAASQNIDLLIWPEAATPFLFEQEPAYQTLVTSLVKEIQVPMVLGSPALRHFPDGRPFLLNSAYLLNSSGEIGGRYDKQHLVPFGEYIPLRGLLFFLDKLVVGIGDFEPGPGPTLLSFPASSHHPAIQFGVAICFEVIFPHLVRGLVNEGANFLVTITNDAWFGNSVAPYQHFAMVVFRAVENRMAFARAANTGISGLIAPNGQILTATPIFTEQAVIGSLPIGSPSTFYTRFGDVFAWICVIIAAVFLGGARPPPRGSVIDSIFKTPSTTKGAPHA